MEKMIKVINDNLRNVISGIKEHRLDLEETLDSIKSDMSLKVKEANAYKSDVETARTIVSTLEGEIADLEHDLEELNDKFGSKNFKEILAAGNREINAKIIEKRTAINEQGQIILGLTDKARSLKDSLIELRERKMVTEENLRKTKILEGYFDTRISEIIKFSEESPEELATYREEIPQEELNIQEDIDISSVIDGSIFEEIDEISSGEPDEAILKSVLANPDEIPVYEPEENVQPIEIEEATTNQLESMISEAKSFVEKKKKENNEVAEEEVKEETEQVEVPKEEENLISEEENVTDDEIESSSEEEETSQNDDNSDEDSDDENAGYVDIYVDDEKEFDDSLENDEVDIDPFLDIRGLQEELGLEEEETEETSDEGEEVIDLKVEEDEALTINIDEALIASENDFKSEPEVDVEKEFSSLGLDLNMFSVDSIESIRKSFDKEEVKKYLEIMKKHELSKDLVYVNARLLIDVTPENLDQILTLLEKTDAKREDISLVFRYLDKVNVSKLEQMILSEVEPSLTVSLSQAIDEVDENVVGSVLGLSRKASEILKKTAAPEDYKIMNALPDVVFENYREIKNLRVDNLEECISKYPHRFTLTHSKFHEILDKYDTDDLIRCINKNAAVIDKL
ncbi:MAG: hypothetical protein HFI73_05275 [Bacilli bacterium]|jgi:hypothetical protein|nr:hypothetical protein [Bacilli bacterium]